MSVLTEGVIALTSLVDWVFGHICYVLSRVLRETGETVRGGGEGKNSEKEKVKGRFRKERLKKEEEKRR